MKELTRSLERTAAPLRSSRVAGFGDALGLLRVTGVITAGRLSLSSVVSTMTFSAIPNRVQWPPGRVAAALLFLAGMGWAFTLYLRPFPWMYAPGYLVWVLWGLRALGMHSRWFLKLTWSVSTLWHLIWFALSIWLLVGSLMWLGFGGLQLLWSIAAFLVSMALWSGNPRNQ